ncbi:MAG: hypothetical protein JXA46_12140 [Dehalococcoidales bacterium]|nr:hypothetical protein [Dehalococcoidales bacterium]
MEKVSVLDPRGQAPLLRRTPMTERLDSLDDKTVYIVHVNWPHTFQFTDELHKVLSGKFPKTTFILKRKLGPYAQDDPKLWAEIQEKGNAAIVSVGH